MLLGLNLGGLGLCVALIYYMISIARDQSIRTASMVRLNESYIAVNQAQAQLLSAQTDLAKAEAAIKWSYAGLMHTAQIFATPLIILACIALSIAVVAFAISAITRCITEYRKLMELKLQTQLAQQRVTSFPRKRENLPPGQQPTIVIDMPERQQVPAKSALPWPTQPPSRRLGPGTPPQKF